MGLSAGILEELLSKENKVLEHWTQRKKRLDQCHQYVLFERSAKQALEWISETGELYLTTHAGSGRNRAENEQLLLEHNEFKGAAKVGIRYSCYAYPRLFWVLGDWGLARGVGGGGSVRVGFLR